MSRMNFYSKIHSVPLFETLIFYNCFQIYPSVHSYWIYIAYYRDNANIAFYCVWMFISMPYINHATQTNNNNNKPTKRQLFTSQLTNSEKTETLNWETNPGRSLAGRVHYHLCYQAPRLFVDQLFSWTLSSDRSAAYCCSIAWLLYSSNTHSLYLNEKEIAYTMPWIYFGYFWFVMNRRRVLIKLDYYSLRTYWLLHGSNEFLFIHYFDF